FSAWRKEDGEELRRVSGTGIGRVFDIAPNAQSSNPNGFVVIGPVLYFRANDGTHGEELWASGGEPYNTYMVYDLLPGASAAAAPSGLTAIGRRLFFAANNGAYGNELWSVDGARELPRLVADIAAPHALAPVIATPVPPGAPSK
ncbi:MAG: hypothetical protein FJY92_02825, partial [Candidatus Hydrogenedentes bacterium]|nr:hypothetical protein [Candidatus Hydrogenedentota bacterium]